MITQRDLDFWEANSDAKLVLADAANKARAAPRWSPLVQLPERDPEIERRRIAWNERRMEEAEKVSMALLQKKMSFSTPGAEIISFSNDAKSRPKASQPEGQARIRKEAGANPKPLKIGSRESLFQSKKSRSALTKTALTSLTHRPGILPTYVPAQAHIHIYTHARAHTHTCTRTHARAHEHNN